MFRHDLFEPDASESAILIEALRCGLRLETQLSDAIDLMVAALQAGAAVNAALENAARETRAPLKPYLEELLGRPNRAGRSSPYCA